MAETPIALYRQGNANSPRMDNVRPNKDVATYEENGRIWVICDKLRKSANCQGGTQKNVK